MVGDRLDTDVLGGNLAGMRTVYLKRGKYGADKPETKEQTPDFEIDDFTEITEVLETNK
jgi:ribonucleotide monophosphatase NagD (HAD superfamily)